MGPILTDWTQAHTDAFQTDILHFQHKLADTGLFEDEALIALMKKHPSSFTDVCTMGETGDPDYPFKFMTGDFRDVDPEVLIAAAKAGKIWINLRMAMRMHDEYRAVLDQMYGELARKTGARIYNPKGGILISSPVARVPYHFDKTETILWHVRGQKTIYIWPVNQRFIPDTAHEAKLTDMIDDDLPYDETFEADATVITLEPGMGATWPLNAPHRVDNNTFCVSVTTEYSTPASAMKNSTMMANAALRRYLKANPLYERDGAIARRAKSLAGRVIKKTPLVKESNQTDMVSFRIDPTVDGYLVETTPYQRDF